MKSIQHQKQQLDKIDSLITSMDYEIKILRNICYRYYLMHGVEIMEGKIDLDNNLSFSTEIDVNNITTAHLIDYSKIGMKSNYQRILEQINELDK